MEKTAWKILLIDDDQEDYMLTRLMLSEAQGVVCSLDWAASFEAGREALQKKTYSAVLMDYDLGGVKGLELIREAVSQGFSSPIILLTGYGSYEVDVEAMEAGATLYLSKAEATPLLLERTIRYAIQYKRVLQELQEARDGLEAKVQRRTAELAQINRELREEINTRKSAENALRRSELQLKQIIGQIPAILWTMDREQNLTRLLGSRFTEIFPRFEDLFGLGWRDAVADKEMVGAIAKSHQEAMLGNGSDFELSIAEHDYHCTVEPFRDIDGDVVGCLGIALDTTAWKRREETIQLQSTALEAAGDGILITDREGVIRWCNPALAAITGYSISEMVGQTPAMFVSGIHSREFFADLWDTILSGREWRGETYNRRKDGTIYVEAQSITPVLDEKGNITNFIAIKQDISDRKEAEEKLTLRNWELQTLNTIGRAVSLSLDISCTFDLIQQLLTSELSISSGTVFSYDQGLAKFQIEAAWGAFQKLSGETILSFIDIPEVVLEGQPVLQAVPASILSRDSDEDGSSRDPSYFLCLPLFSQQTVQGLLALSLEGSKIHRDGQLYFLSSLGSRLGVAIQNAKLFKAEEQAHRLAETLRRASLALSNSLDLDVVIQNLFDSVQNLVPETDRIILLSREEGFLQVTASAGKQTFAFDRPLELLDESRHPLLSSGSTRLVEDTRDCPDWKPLLGGLLARSWLGIPIMVAGDRIGLCCLESETAGCFSPQDIYLAEALVGQAATAIQNARLYQQVRDSREHLQALSRKLVEVQEMERRYIARELHDETSQALIGLVFALEILKKDAGDPNAVEAGVNELNRIIGDIIKSLHRLAVDLRPAALDHLGLIPALRQYLDGVREKHGLAMHLAAPDLPGRLPLEVETTLYRIVQEAMANVIRHAGATRADVSVSIEEDKIRASIADNGRGFNLDEALAKERLGLFGMRERVEMLDGSLAIDSSPGHGTRILVEIPYVVPNIDCG